VGPILDTPCERPRSKIKNHDFGYEKDDVAFHMWLPQNVVSPYSSNNFYSVKVHRANRIY